MNIKIISGKLVAAAAGLTLAASAIAAVTDLSTSPLVTSSSSSVLPNIFLMMDDSGSMNWDFVPDYPPGSSPFSTSKYGYASHQCNGMYYNPAINYAPPAKYDGTSYTNASFTGAWMDGFKTSAGTLDLSSKFAIGLYQSASAPSSGVPAYYYKYLGSQTLDSQKNYYNSSTTFYTECNTTAAANPTATISISGSASTSVTGITVNGVQIMSGSSTASTSSSTVATNIAAKISLGGFTATASGSTVTITGPASAAAILPVVSQSGGMTLSASSFTPFAKVVVSSTSGPGGTDERQNFANWFSYYRTRVNMMKTGAGIAFKPLDNHYRVGFATMNNNGGSKFLNLATFNPTQKQSWYTMLYSVTVGSSTPLLNALSNVGLMYGNKLPGNTLNGVAVADPVQYSCQQNFTILSTDGFWNDATNSDLNGASVGNQDGDQPRPYNDGQIATVTAATPTTSTVRNQTDTPKTVTTKWSRTSKTTAATKGTGGCNSSNYLVTTQGQIYNQVKQQTATSIDDTVTTTVHTVITSNGVVTSDTTSAPSTTVNNVSSSTTTTSDTGTPTGGTTWANNGSPTTACSSSPNPPAGQTTNTTPTSSAPTTVTGTATVTQLSSTGPTVGATTTNTTTSGGTSNTLADVAMYYYKTDIRNTSFGNCTGALGADVCQDNVPKTNQDTASWQHMTTFTLGLGAFGRMQYSPTYATDGSGDYVSVKNGVTANPAGGICSWGTAGQVCNWPTPNVSGTLENIDDLWHAAVNGRGAYFSATNPTTLAAGLSSALSGIAARTGASAAATTSNPNVSTGDNFLFSSTFNTGVWDGNIIRQQINLTTGQLSSTVDWSAQAQFDAGLTRTLYTYSASATGKIKTFGWASLTATEQGYFGLSNLTGNLTQFCASGANCLSATDQANAAGANLVAFLAGDRTNEGALVDTSKYYRQRSLASDPHPNVVLGDIVNAEAVYVKGSLYNYADTGYGTFVNTNSTRAGRVFVASNDGMLHAFDSATGVEKWAYFPSFVLPSLYKLADKNYANLHQYYVDGTPVSGDIYFGGAWHTIVVGGLNGGGRGYYALDVTDPTVAPKVLWEFSDTNMGYTYGNPVITKLSDGTWAVLVTSGYNNVSSGDGKGYLYVLNAADGSVIRTISTGVGDTTTPSGLAKITAYATTPNVDNTSLRAYGGDLLGNLWRFDINAGTVQLIVTLKDNSVTPKVQPITTKPELGDVNGVHMVYVGTGKYLGVTDLADTSKQTIYGIKDTLGTPTGALYSSSRTGFIQQTVTTTTCPTGAPTSVCSTGEVVRTTSSNVVNLASDNGWYVDLPDSGERVNTDIILALGTLFLTSNVPNATACTVGGYSFGWQLDYRTGSAVTNTKNVGAVKIDNTLATRPVPVSLPNNTVVVYTRKSDGTTDVSSGHINNTSNSVRRVTWRELTDD